MSARITSPSLLQRLALLALAFLLVGCGGGATSTSTLISNGGGALSSNIGNTSATVCSATPEQLQPYGGVSSGSASSVYMDNCATAGTLAAVNLPYISVNVCAPSGACAWIDHVLVDTGSVGLRLLADALPPALLASLPSTPVAGSTASVGECFQFVVSYMWGGVRTATVNLGGTVPASGGAHNGSVSGTGNIFILNDPNVPATVPASCSTAAGIASPQAKAAIDFGANGIIGIGMLPDDASNGAATYYQCLAGSCTLFPATTTTAAGTPPPGAAVVNPLAAAHLSAAAITLDAASTIHSHTVTYSNYGLPGFVNASALVGTLSYLSGPPTPSAKFYVNPYSQRMPAQLSNGSASANFPTSTTTFAGAFMDSGSNAYFYTQTDLSPQVLAMQNCPFTTLNSSGQPVTSQRPFACNLSGQTTIPLVLALKLGSDIGPPPAPSTTTASATTVVSPGLSFYDYNFLNNSYPNSPVLEGLTVIETTSPSPFAGQFDLGLPFFLGRPVYISVSDGVNQARSYYGL